jgi:hypothetical protein
MGGLVARQMWGTQAQQNALNADPTYSQGWFHKLVTLGTPHLGSHYAMRLMDGSNECIRDLTGNASYRNSPDEASIAIEWVRIGQRQYSGAILDLIGDGTLKNSSEAIQKLSLPADGGRPPLKISLVAAVATAKNINALSLPSSLMSLPLWVQQGAKLLCGETVKVGEYIPGDFLADNYEAGGWQKIFNGEPMDGFVSKKSALNGWAEGAGTKVFYDLAHGSGTVTEIGFAGPHLQSDERVATWVITLLNVSRNDSTMFRELR